MSSFDGGVGSVASIDIRRTLTEKTIETSRVETSRGAQPDAGPAPMAHGTTSFCIRRSRNFDETITVGGGAGEAVSQEDEVCVGSEANTSKHRRKRHDSHAGSCEYP